MAHVIQCNKCISEDQSLEKKELNHISCYQLCSLTVWQRLFLFAVSAGRDSLVLLRDGSI